MGNRLIVLVAIFLLVVDIIAGTASSINSSSFCTASNGICPIYSLNFAPKASGPNALNQNIPHATQFCTGLTSGPLTTSGTHQILVTYTWNAASVNVTGQLLRVTFKIGTVAPVTVFQSGLCAASGATQLGISGVYLAVLGAGNIFSAVFVGSSSQPAGVYYAWVEFQAVTTDVKLDSFSTTSFVTMLEVK